ncbi:extracellular catalytic domain type 1 short-chain-length polyhydroxyalkanoate depolymerase [Thauera sinica]|uniref:Alpha/beta hydrolase family esterase n=1 Tax=Thauera sinica TaxID=2665146 RepID=A0ABW1ARK6_9RHOO|nr:PHB depolymerase family esterase [Thauera sp. K11]ATE61535.1 phospholipase [Thauera sp. K11]
MTKRRTSRSPLGGALRRAMTAMARAGLRAGGRMAGEVAGSLAKQAVDAAAARLRPPPGPGDWITGQAIGAGGARRYFLFRPPGVSNAERLPLMVMLHGCGQTAASFARSTRMNRLAVQGRFLVLYPEQDRRVNPQGCWDWYGTVTRQAHAEASTLMAAVDQVCLLYPVDRTAVAVAGLSAGAGMAALLGTLHPERFRAVVMHSGVAPGAAHSAVSALAAMGGRREPELPAAAQSLPPLLVIQGDRDRVVAPANGIAAAQSWAAAAGAAAAEPRALRRGKRHPAMVTDFKLKKRLVASLCLVEGLGHAWSGGDARQPFSDARGPDASKMAWAFVARQLDR